MKTRLTVYTLVIIDIDKSRFISHLEGLAEFSVDTFEDCLNLMTKGEKNRHIRQTSANIKSSRSHTIFQVIIESTIADKEGRLQVIIIRI